MGLENFEVKNGLGGGTYSGPNLLGHSLGGLELGPNGFSLGPPLNISDANLSLVSGIFRLHPVTDNVLTKALKPLGTGFAPSASGVSVQLDVLDHSQRSVTLEGKLGRRSPGEGLFISIPGARSDGSAPAGLDGLIASSDHTISSLKVLFGNHFVEVLGPYEGLRGQKDPYRALAELRSGSIQIGYFQPEYDGVKEGDTPKPYRVKYCSGKIASSAESKEDPGHLEVCIMRPDGREIVMTSAMDAITEIREIAYHARVDRESFRYSNLNHGFRDAVRAGFNFGTQIEAGRVSGQAPLIGAFLEIPEAEGAELMFVLSPSGLVSVPLAEITYVQTKGYNPLAEPPFNQNRRPDGPRNLTVSVGRDGALWERPSYIAPQAAWIDPSGEAFYRQRRAVHG